MKFLKFGAIVNLAMARLICPMESCSPVSNTSANASDSISSVYTSFYSSSSDSSDELLVSPTTELVDGLPLANDVTIGPNSSSVDESLLNSPAIELSQVKPPSLSPILSMIPTTVNFQQVSVDTSSASQASASNSAADGSVR